MFRLRLLRLVAFWLLRPPLGFLDTHTFALRAWPLTDIDVSRMMAHAYTRAFAFGRYQIMLASEFRGAVVKKRWFPMVVADITYLYKSVALLEAFDVRSRIVAWDDKRFYVEQEIVVRGEIRARCIAEGLVGSGKTFLNPNEVFRELGVLRESPEIPVEIAAWIDNRKPRPRAA